MGKQAAPKVKDTKRRRFGKRKGSAGGRSELRYYPKYGDSIDQMTRRLYKLICITPSEKWGCDASGKAVA